MIYTDTLTPTSYATKLATYIDNPTTIRAHVKNYFGRAPSVDICARLRQQHLAKQAARTPSYRCHERFVNFRCGHPQTDDNLILLANGIERCKTCEEQHIAKIEAERAERERREAEERAARHKASMMRSKISAELEKAPTQQGTRPRLTRETVKLVSLLMKLDPKDVLGPGRAQRFVDARAVCVRVFRAAGMSYPQISKALNRKDHSTSINLMSTFNERAALRPHLWDVYDAVVGR